MKKVILLLLLTVSFLITFSQHTQKKEPTKPKFFLTAGYGLAGSFFVTGVSEFNPSPQSKTFAKNNFIGNGQNIALGLRLKKGYQFNLGLTYQHFTRHIKTTEQYNNLQVYFDHDIHHRDYIWYASVNKNLTSLAKKSQFNAGLGIYYIVALDQAIELYTGYVLDYEKVWKGSYNGEAGVFAEFAYEYKFQPRVNLGIKTQFYYTATAAYAESVTLYPYIRILF